MPVFFKIGNKSQTTKIYNLKQNKTNTQLFSFCRIKYHFRFFFVLVDLKYSDSFALFTCLKKQIGRNNGATAVVWARQNYL